MTKILLVENDPLLASSIQNGLNNHDLTVKKTTSLQRAYQLLATEKFDLAIIDRCLDDGDGLSLVNHLQACHYYLKILVLTQKNASSDRVDGLTNGADDYLGKPFAYAELMLRVKNLLNKQKIADSTVYQLKQMEINTATGQIIYQGLVYSLRRREMEILKCLLQHKNAIIDRQSLIDHVWTESEVPTFSTIDVYIRRLRTKIPVKGLIKTIKGFGYQLTE